MALKTFTGQTMQDAMAKVKAAVGDDALIVSNREIKRKTLTTPGLYEIVVEVEDSKSTIKQKSKQTKQKEPNNYADDVMLKISKAAQEINSITISKIHNHKY